MPPFKGTVCHARCVGLQSPRDLGLPDYAAAQVEPSGSGDADVIWTASEVERVGALADRRWAGRLLTGKYLEGIPAGSRAAAGGSFPSTLLGEDTRAKVRALAVIAQRRGQSLAQMALAWTLRDPRVTSALVGAGSVDQLEENVAALQNLEFSATELAEIDRHATDSGINLWAASSEA